VPLAVPWRGGESYQTVCEKNGRPTLCQGLRSPYIIENSVAAVVSSAVLGVAHLNALEADEIRVRGHNPVPFTTDSLVHPDVTPADHPLDEPIGEEKQPCHP
jgi:hypothetical protein